MSKLINLYIDIDGVLFGNYGPNKKIQLRPGVNDFLNFCIENFNPFWLTYWTPDEIKNLCEATYNVREFYLIEYANWEISKVDGIDLNSKFIWLDDEPNDRDIKKLAGHKKLKSLIKVNPSGMNELERVKEILISRMEKNI